MISTYRYSVSSPMPLDLNEEDQSHHLFSTNHQPSSSTSSLSCPILFNTDQDQLGSYYWEPKHLQSHEEGKKIIPYSGSWDHPAAAKVENSSDHKLKVWKKEEGGEDNAQAEDAYGSLKWMPSKMRIMRRMMMSDQKGSDPDVSAIPKHKFEEQKQLSPIASGTDNNSNSSSGHSNITVRVCADCHTTKTPLWRSGPRGPKSLCNACGIRQRKARRAMAAAASSNGTILMAAEPSHVKRKFYNKEKKKKKKLKNDGAPQLKKKNKTCIRGRKKFGFEELTISLSKDLALSQVFPQDEKEAAILLMALSYGLLHGFPSDRYLDL